MSNKTKHNLLECASKNSSTPNKNSALSSLDSNIIGLQATSIVEAFPDPFIRLDANGKVRFANKVFINAFNLKLKDLVGKTPIEVPSDVFTGKSPKRIHDAFLKVKETHKEFIFHEWGVNDFGKTCHEVRHIPEFDQTNNFTGILGFIRDITEEARLKNLAGFLAASSKLTGHSFYTTLTEYLANLLGMNYVLIQTVDKSTDNITLLSEYGLPKTPLSPYPYKGSVCEKSLTLKNAGYSEGICEKNPNDTFIKQLAVNSGAAVPLKSADNKVLGFLTLLRTKNIPLAKGKQMKELVDLIASRIVIELDNQRLKDTEAAHREDFRVLVESSPDAISRFDANGKLLYVNPTLQALGYSVDGKTPEHSSAEEQQIIIDRVFNVLKTGENSKFIDKMILGPKKVVKYMDVRVSAELDSTGQVIGALVVGREITERIELEEELRKQASIDTLTGLPNRRLFFDNLDIEITKAKRKKQKVALLFIDLDRFKEINDTLGHHEGDMLLVQSASRIKTIMRESDMVARLGGDEFVILLTDVKEESSIALIAQNIIKLLSEPYNLNGISAYISASIGIAIYPADTTSPSDLITFADQAMYSAKTIGRSTYKFFTPAMQIQSNERVSMVNDLRMALKLNQFKVYYQPIIDIHSKKIIKAEALIRWFHPERGLVRPDQFIPLAEDTGLINDIGDWVFKESIAMTALWRQKVNHNIQISINISPRQFNQNNIVHTWLNWLNDINLPPSCVTLELTESLLLDEQEGLQKKLNHIRESGMQIALDDFGTGYSAMSYLKKFNIDFLKIDGSFIRDMTEDENDCAITETIVLMAAKLGMKSIAECVETKKQEQLLKGFGCDYLQGYLYAKPMPIEEFLAHISGQ